MSITPATHYGDILPTQKPEPHTLEWIWNLFNALPKSRPQLHNSKEATARVMRFRNKSPLPKRRAYTSTVDYYEAYLPLYMARRHFLGATKPGSITGLVMQACATILPKNLF